MRIRTTLRLIPAVLLALAVSVLAGEPGDSLPPRFAGQLSLKSPQALLEAMDAYTAAATKATPQEIPAGILTLLASMYLPVPLDTWKADDEAHLLFLKKDGSQPALVAVIGADDFSALTDSLDDRGWSVSETEGAGGFTDAVTAVPPEGKPLFLVDAGNGKVAASDRIDNIAAALAEGWLPDYAGSADIYFTFAVDIPAPALEERARSVLAESADKFVRDLERNGIKPEVTQGFIAATRKYLPLLAREIDLMHNVTLEIRLDAENAVFNISGGFGDGSLLAEMAGVLAGAPALSNPLARNVPDSAVSISLMPAIAAFLPNAPERLADFTLDFYSMILPELAPALKKTTDDYFAAGPGGSVTAGCYADTRQYNLSLIAVENPAMAVQSFLDGSDLFGQAWNAVITDPSYGLTLKAERIEENGVTYHRLSPDFADPEKFRRALAEFSQKNEQFYLDFDMLQRIRTFITTMDGIVVMGMGDLTDAEFLAGFASIREAGASPFLEREAVKKMMPLLADATGNLTFIDIDRAFLIVVAEISKSMDVVLGSAAGDAYRRALGQMEGKLKNRGDVAGMGLSADGNRLNGRFVFPAAAANAIIHDYSQFDRLSKLELKAAVEATEADRDDDAEEKDHNAPDEEVDITDADDAA